MDTKKLQYHFLIALLVGVMIFTFFVLRPFIYVIVLALVCATVFEPMHQKILYVVPNKALAALGATLVIIVIMLVPFIFLGIKIFQETQQFFLIVGSERDTFAHILNGWLDGLQRNFPFEQRFSIDAGQYVRQGSMWLLNHLGYIFGSITKLLFNFFIFIIIIYYAFKDGQKFKKAVIGASPLADPDDEAILTKIKMAINSVVRGNLAVAPIQGVLVAIGFALFGVPHVLLWGIAATIAALIPGIGTAIVVIPAVIFVFLTKNTFLALGLLAWGALLVGLIDNFLRPIFIGRGIKVHPLIVFLSVIGGIVFLGPIGFLLGPLAISLLFTLLEIYPSLRDSQVS